MRTANTATIAMIVTIALMIGIIGTSTVGVAMATDGYDSSVLLDNKDASWQLTPGDSIGVEVLYNAVGDEFDWMVTGTGMPSTEYSLIYYADKPDRFNNWGGDNPGALIGTMTSDDTGIIDASGSIDLGMNLPCSPDANIDQYDYSGAPDNYTNAHGAKLWMVPSVCLSGYPGPDAWSPHGYSWSAFCQPIIMFETDLITYTYTPTTVSIGDVISCEGDISPITIPIMVSNADNVGAVNLRLDYDKSLVTVTSVTGSAMDNMVPNLGHAGDGYVTIGAYQSTSAGLNDDFVLAQVEFTPTGVCGEEPIGISVTTFTDSTYAAAPMSCDTIFGVFCSSTCICGDVNGNGVVDMGDVMVLAKHIAGLSEFTSIADCAADVDGSGDVDSNDVSYLASHLVGITGYEDLKCGTCDI